MTFGFGRPSAAPAGLTADDLAAILAGAPPGASTIGQQRPFSLGPLAGFTGAPLMQPGAQPGETMAAPTFGGGITPDDEASRPDNSIPAPGSVMGHGPHADPNARPLGPMPTPQGITSLPPFSFGGSMGSPASPAVSGPEFDRRFDASPPGESYGLTASAGEAMRAGLTQAGSGMQAGRVVRPSPDVPTRDAVPAAGGAPAPSFAVPPASRPSAAIGATGVQPAVASAPAQADTPAPGGIMDSFLSRLGDPRVYNTLLGIGQGLLTTKGFGPGIAAGASYASKLNRDQAATDLAQAEYGLKTRKAAQEAAGQNATVEMLVRAGHTREAAQGMVMAAVAGNREALSNALGNLVPKTPEVPFGWEKRADGTIAPVSGGPQSLGYKRDTAQAGAEGAAAGKPDEPFNLSPGQTRYDATGKPIVSAAPQKPEGFDAEMKLRNEFNKNLGTFQDVHDGYNRVIAATKQREDNPKAKSPASDISLVFGYMKMLDPGSVVREGEYATAKNAAGIPVQVQNAYNKALSGEFLSDTQRRDFLGQAAELYGAARNGAEGVAGRYRGLATHYGVDPDRSVYLPAKPVPPQIGGDARFGSIPEAAVQMLKRDQSLRDQFDAKFGAGAADATLGKQ